MQSHNSNNFFQPHQIIDEYDPSEVAGTAIVIDPNIFFFSLHSSNPEHPSLHIHPILRSWLDTLRSNPENDHIRFYLLASHNNSIGLTVDTNCGQLFTPITVNHLPSMISPDSADYVNQLFGYPYKTAMLYQHSSIGLISFTDYNTPLKEELLVITSDAELAQFFRCKQVAVTEMDTLRKPLLSKPIDLCPTTHKLEIYSDFDRTLFDIDTHFTTVNTHYTELRRKQPEHNAPSIDKNIILTQKHTISFLENYREHPIYLITQRPYPTIEDASIAPTDAPHLCNDVATLISHINTKHSLSIQVNKESFLDWATQFQLTNRFDKKIQKIFERLYARPAKERPTHVLLLDDDIVEILKCVIAKEHYEKLNINLHYALITNPSLFGSNYLDMIKSNSLELFNQLDEIFKEEVTKLFEGYNKVKIPFKNNIDEIPSEAIIDDNIVINEPDDSALNPYRMCVIS